MKLNPYPEYKDYGVPWLGKIPTHWEVLPNRAIFEEKNVKNSNIENLLSVTIKRGVIQQSELLENSSKKDSSNEDKSNYKLVLPGYITYNKMRMWQGAVGASKYKGIVSPAYIVIKPRKNANPWYYHYLMRTPYYTRESFRNSYGICDDQLSLRFKDFKVIMSPLPPLEEQKAIVAFSRNIDKQINIFIRGKRKLIELLKEQKQAIINRAVIRGLDPDVRLKPSGIDWLGDIPENWEVRKLRRIVKSVKTGGTPSGADEKYFRENGFNWFTPGDFKENLFLDKSERPLSDLGRNNVVSFPPNTLMMIGIGATIGKVSITKVEAGCNQQINGIITGEKVMPEFLAYYFRCIRQFIIACGKYTTIPIINQEETKNLPVILPKLREQESIVDYIKRKNSEIDSAILRAEREIELIREYRTRLIADVVTGKVDVRDIPVEESPDSIDIEKPEEFDPSLETAEPAGPQENPDEND